MIQRAAFVIAISMLLIACAPKTAPQDEHARALSQAATIAPADARLATLYSQSCKACHAIDNSGAPLVQDRSLWDARWEKGMTVLMQSTVAGLNGMPPGGQCFACTAADYEALIKFLAGRP
jgi:cytochrome c5